MSCTELKRRPGRPPHGLAGQARLVALGWLIGGVGGVGGLLGGCAQQSAAPTKPTAGATGSATRAPAAPAVPVEARARSWEDYRLRAARRLVAANPDRTHTGEVEQPSLAIPVLEVELRADGSIQRINVMRYPSQAKETTQMAIEAVQRAAPFGDVSHLPKPWKFSEVFLFNADHRFKPRTLDQ